MFRSLARNVLRLMAFSSLFVVPALAQFEIAPDHFDSAEKKKVAQNVAKTRAKTAQPATVPAAAVASVSAGAATIRDPQKGGQSARHAAQHVQPGRKVQRNLSGNQVAAARKRSDKERTVATTR